MFTGAYVAIADKNESVDIEVFGGDCFISKANYKVNQQQLGCFVTNGDPFPCGPVEMSRLKAYPDCEEVISLYVESVINTDLCADKFSYPVVDNGTISEFRSKYNYEYNFAYSAENDIFTFTSRSDFARNRTKFPARVIWSDQKIYQTDVEGFDKFRASSFRDLEEGDGQIVKLEKLNNNNIYCFQETAVTVLPVFKSVIEDSQGGEMIINSSAIINNPQYLLTENGCQNMRTVATSSDHIFFVDVKKKEIFKIGASSGKISTVQMYSYFTDKLTESNGIEECLLLSGYDFNNEEYIVNLVNKSDSQAKNEWAVIWSDKLNVWTTEIDYNRSSRPASFVFCNQSYWLLGEVSNGSILLESMYTGDTYGLLLDSIVDSTFSVIINPDGSYGKIFDNILIDANNRLDIVEFEVDKEVGDTSYTDPISAYVKPREGSYWVPTRRDGSNRRMRGKYCIARFLMGNGNNVNVSVKAVLTKYRLDKRMLR